MTPDRGVHPLTVMTQLSLLLPPSLTLLSPRPVFTGVWRYHPGTILELKMLGGEFQSILDININTFTGI